MRYFGIALLLLGSIGLTSVSAQVVSRIAAVVNKELITTHQLDQRLQQQLAKKERQPSPVQMGALRRELLSRMIEEALVQQRITALNLSVSEEEIETALLDVQKKNKLSSAELAEAVEVQGLDFDDYRDNLRQQILRYKLIGEEVRSQIDVPEREVVEYYRAHLDDYRLAPEVELSAISFPISEKASDQERKQIRKMAAEALVRLQQGEDLAVVADSYNKTYGAIGGEMGRFEYGDLTPAFAAAITAGACPPRRLHPVGQDGDEDDVVDAQDDLENRQGRQGDPGFRAVDPFHDCRSSALLACGWGRARRAGRANLSQ